MSCACDSTRYKIKLIHMERHSSETYSFDFESPELNNWSEGDNSKLYVSFKEKAVGKKFSYATLPNESVIRFTTRIKDKPSVYKETLFALKIGDHIEVTQPSGAFKLKRDNRPVVLLSNGVGIAANRSLIKAYENDPSGIPEMIQINVDATGSIYKDEFDLLMTDNETFKSFYESHRTSYYKRLDHEIQNLLVSTDVDPYLYIVGSDGFVRDNINHLKSVGFGDEDIITDSHIPGETACDCNAEDACGCGGNLVQLTTSKQFTLPSIKSKVS